LKTLAFDFSKTRTICDAFDEAWAFLQGLGSDLTQAPKSLVAQSILAKRIIEMADQGLRDIPALRDDALAFLQHGPMLRHGCGYALANAGHDMRALQAWLGHKNIQHTVRYTELGPDRFRNFRR